MCPNSLEAATEIMGVKIDVAEKQVKGLKASRRKRSVKWKLQIKRTLSLTFGLPVHLLFLSSCILTAPTVVVGFRLWFLIIPPILAIIARVSFGIIETVEKIVVPSGDMHTFEKAMRKYDAKIDKWAGIK
ncbi:hypothetical protein Ddc_19149 [Ditylenchus destructor]|nr:hypothetical protein Ddc_19149 [Ditylenchus destructor]